MTDTSKASRIPLPVRRRAEVLALVAEGLVEPSTVVSMAAAPGNEALLAMPLRSLLAAHELWDDRTADDDVRKILAVCGRDGSSADVTLQWLFHRKATRARLAAFADIVRTRTFAAADRNEAPWPGFPMTPQPTAPVAG
ncbi:MAG: hypothetical protein V4737_01260 [Curtobacterium sp.]